MISVQNLLRLLNGNKLLVALSFLFVSCSASKPVFDTSNSQIVKTSTKVDKTTQDTIKSPLLDRETLDNSKDKRVIDTIRWKDVSDKNKAIEIPAESKNKAGGFEYKEVYNVKLLLPLNADKINDPGASRFTYFYAGALLALEELGEEGVKLNVDIIDTEAQDYNLEKNMTKLVSPETDMIIGPFERESIKKLSEICKEKEVVLVSPWYTSSRLTTQNPYYVQMNPNLKEHFLKLVNYSVKSYKPEEISILVRGDNDQPWVDYFEGEAKKLNKGKDFFKTYKVNTDSLKLGPTAFFTMLKDTKLKAVIIPNYSYNDESYIYSCLRRLAAEVGSRSISVMGMPILYDSDKVEFDYYRTLQMKVVMADYVDENYGKIREFRRRFLDTYGEIPTAEAVKGHDLILFLGRNIKKYGRKFQDFAAYDFQGYLQSIYDIRRSVSDDASEQVDSDYFDYYENKHLDIIEFRGNKWIRN